MNGHLQRAASACRTRFGAQATHLADPRLKLQGATGQCNDKAMNVAHAERTWTITFLYREESEVDVLQPDAGQYGIYGQHAPAT